MLSETQALRAPERNPSQWHWVRLCLTRRARSFTIYKLIRQLKTIGNSVKPFSLARLSSLRKEGKSASWISFSLGIAVRFAFAGAHFIPRSPGFTRQEIRCLGLLAVQKFLPSVLICFANPTPSNFFTGRRSLISFGQPSQNPPLGLLAFTRFSIPFRIFILKILYFINLVHMAVRSLRSTPQPLKIRKKKSSNFH